MTAITLAENFAEIGTRIGAAARAAGRDPAAVTLVAVSKVQPEERIEAALATGQRIFGENRVQEAEARWAGRRAAGPDLQLHLIGPLQTNKAKDAGAPVRRDRDGRPAGSWPAAWRRRWPPPAGAWTA